MIFCINATERVNMLILKICRKFIKHKVLVIWGITNKYFVLKKPLQDTKLTFCCCPLRCGGIGCSVPMSGGGLDVLKGGGGPLIGGGPDGKACLSGGLLGGGPVGLGVTEGATEGGFTGGCPIGGGPRIGGAPLIGGGPAIGGGPVIGGGPAIGGGLTIGGGPAIGGGPLIGGGPELWVVGGVPWELIIGAWITGACETAGGALRIDGGGALTIWVGAPMIGGGGPEIKGGAPGGPTRPCEATRGGGTCGDITTILGGFITGCTAAEETGRAGGGPANDTASITIYRFFLLRNNIKKVWRWLYIYIYKMYYNR